jgi:rod shape-determining protein MreB
VQYIKRKYNMAIGSGVAEQIKMNLGIALQDDERVVMEIKGSNLVMGIPTTMDIGDDEIRESINDTINTIVDAIKHVLETTPPELAADLVDKGIVLAGGGALLKNLDVILREETKLPVTIADDPLTCVALGAGKVLDEMKLLKEVTLPE